MTNEVNAILIRQYVDGELAPEAVAAFESRLESDADLRSAVEFERSLRDRVASCMCDEHSTAPDELRSSIHALFAQTASADAHEAEADVPVIATIGRDASPQPLRSAWRGWAVAASLLLVAGAVLFGIFGPEIGQIQNQPQLVTVGDVAESAAGEHRVCAMDKSQMLNKLTWTDPADTRRELSKRLNFEVTIFDLDIEGLDYEFKGGGMCALPGCEETCHVFYGRKPTEERGGAMISIYMTPDYGQFDTLPKCPQGNTAWDMIPASSRCCMDVQFCRDSSMIYVVVCCDGSDSSRVSAEIDRQLRARAEDSAPATE